MSSEKIKKGSDNEHRKERNVWNNLRARHYSVIILFAIVALETSAIAIDKFINRESEVAFSIESPFQNNPFIQSFNMAEAACAPVPVKITRSEKPAIVIRAEKKSAVIAPNEVLTEGSTRSVSANFVAATNTRANFSNYIEYSVQQGDSLSNIAMRFGSEANAIQSANELEDANSIKAGQTIKVPMPGKEMYYTVKRGDSLSKIANRFRVSLKELVKENNLKSHMLLADQRIKIPFSGKPEVTLIKSEEPSAVEKTQKLELVKNTQHKLIPEQKLALVSNNSKIQIAQAQAPATKPTINFIEKDLLASPPAIKANHTAKASKVEEKTDTKEIKVSEARPAEKKEEITYSVVRGDNLLKIAHRFKTTVAQIQQANDIKGTMVKIGQQLTINPGKKLYRVVKAGTTNSTENKTLSAKSKATAEPTERIVSHKVKSGESLSLIARKYRTSISSIVAENNLTSTLVKINQTLKVPTNAKNFRVVKTTSTRSGIKMRMPVRGRLSDKYGWRNHPVYRKRLFHAGIDVAAPRGAPIAAAMRGKVIYAGRRSGYGKMVILSHANGYSTRYAHCSSIIVKKGQIVKSGQLIARVGATGVATGNHLHFEVRKNGKTQNPQTYLK